MTAPRGYAWSDIQIRERYAARWLFNVRSILCDEPPTKFGARERNRKNTKQIQQPDTDEVPVPMTPAPRWGKIERDLGSQARTAYNLYQADMHTKTSFYENALRRGERPSHPEAESGGKPAKQQGAAALCAMPEHAEKRGHLPPSAPGLSQRSDLPTTRVIPGPGIPTLTRGTTATGEEVPGKTSPGSTLPKALDPQEH